MSLPLKSFHVPRESMGYAKKRKNREISMLKKHERKKRKNACQRA
jgi:hypothetical protein